MKKILVLEESEPVRENLITLLEMNSYEAIYADSGPEGFELAINHLPDLIIVDISRPTIEYFEFIKELRSNSFTENIPLIFLTSEVTEYTFKRENIFGAVAFIKNPYRAKEVLDTISNTLNNRNKF